MLTAAYQSEVSSRAMPFSGDADTIAKLQGVSRWLVSDGVKPCLLLYGGVGNGKSSMAKAVRDMFVAIKNTYENTKEWWRCTQEQQKFIENIRNTLPVPVFISATDIVKLASSDMVQYDSLKNCRFLIIDDMGIEPSVVKNFGTEITPLTDIIYARYDRMAMTIITSNLDDESITERYGERVSDRLNEIFERLNYENKSYR